MADWRLAWPRWPTPSQAWLAVAPGRAARRRAPSWVLVRHGRAGQAVLRRLLACSSFRRSPTRRPSVCTKDELVQALRSLLHRFDPGARSCIGRRRQLLRARPGPPPAVAALAVVVSMAGMRLGQAVRARLQPWPSGCASSSGFWRSAPILHCVGPRAERLMDGRRRGQYRFGNRHRPGAFHDRARPQESNVANLLLEGLAGGVAGTRGPAPLPIG